MANTRETMGDQACLDALVAGTLTSFEDNDIQYVTSALANSNSLHDVTLTKIIHVYNDAFKNDSALVSADVTCSSNLSSSAFNSCMSLKHVVLRDDSHVPITSIAYFSETPIEMGFGAIYVPTEILDAYKNKRESAFYTILPISKYPATDFSTIDDSWSDIITACGNGTYSTKYNVGDIKSIEIDGVTTYMKLVAKDSDVLASDGTTTVPTTWIISKVNQKTNRFNPRNDNGAQGTGANGGWEYSEMRSWLNNTVLPLLPSEVRTAIKEVRKYSDYVVAGESTITHDQMTADKLWIPSAREVFGGTSYEQTGPIYSYLADDNYQRIRYTGSIRNKWLTRSAYSVSDFYSLSTTGSVAHEDPRYSYSPILGFCI